VTDAFDILVALFAGTVINLVIVSQIRRRCPGAEGTVLARIYTATVALRFALALFLNFYSGQSNFASMFWGDSFQYDAGGWAQALQWKGEVMVNPWMAGRVSGWGFFYVVAATYSVFGHNQLMAQLVNATVGSLTVLVIYALAKELFEVEVALWAAGFMAFFPQMVFWSGAIYKDPAIMFCIAICMYAVVKLNRTFAVRYVAMFVAGSLALMTLRFYVFYFVAFATLGTFVLTQRRGVMGNVIVSTLLGGTFVAAFSLAASRETIDQQRSYFDLRKVQISRSDLATSSSGFEAKADVSTAKGALSALPIGLVYLLFAPFPWAVRGVRQLLTVPETLAWYALWPALIRGLRLAVRHRFRASLPIVVFAVLLTCAYAVFQGNIGTAYRQRTQVTMFFFVFMAAGVVEKRRAREAAIPLPLRPPLPVR
jgi:4-amino-4-deoxy-L-arabinose transferase-like glycosyltransferase